MRIRNKDSVEVWANKDIRSGTVEICFAKTNQNFTGFIHAKPMEWAPEVTDDSASPAISLGYEVATQLMDQLWYSGIRPSENLTNAGERKALENHINTLNSEIEFLRRVISQQLGMV